MSDPITEPRKVLIDGLNLAYWCGAPPSLRIPLSVFAGLLARQFEAWLYFDASARHQLVHEADLYRQLLRHTSQIIEVPSGQPADRTLLRQARRVGGCIVSRDRFRDHRQRYRRLIDDSARVFGGSVNADRMQIPALGLDTPLYASAQAAWHPLAPLLQPVALG